MSYTPLDATASAIAAGTTNRALFSPIDGALGQAIVACAVASAPAPTDQPAGEPAGPVAPAGTTSAGR